jgi:hypothetical protein
MEIIIKKKEIEKTYHHLETLYLPLRIPRSAPCNKSIYMQFDEEKFLHASSSPVGRDDRSSAILSLFPTFIRSRIIML